MFIKPKQYVGVGINYRTAVAKDILVNIHHLDCVEMNTERLFIDFNHPLITEIRQRVPVVLHGLTLSIGTDQEISESYLTALCSTLQKSPCAWFSEHLAVTHINQLAIRGLMPVAFNTASLSRIVKKAKHIQATTNHLFLLENIAYYYVMPESDLLEHDFLTTILNEADCGLLLDLTNLFVNAMNHRYNPYEFIDALPLDRIVAVHLAGCDWIDNMWVDTHASPVRREVLDLLAYLVRKTPVNGVIIERDARLELFSKLIDEVYIVRNLLQAVRPRV